MTWTDFIALLGGAGHIEGGAGIPKQRMDRSAARLACAAIAAIACWTLPAAAQPVGEVELVVCTVPGNSAMRAA